MNRPRIISLVMTALIAVLIVVMMLMVKISVDTTVKEWPPRHDGEILVAEDEHFFDVIRDIQQPMPSLDEAAPAINDANESNQSDPAPTTGHDIADAGNVGDAPTTVTSKRPSDVKQPVAEQPVSQGPSQQQQAEDEARRRANAATATAFQRSGGNNNTSNRGASEGNSGSVGGTSTTFNGVGTGRVSGGWILPKYQKVHSTVTGKIEVRVIINRKGEVTKVEFRGGTPPAATDPDLRQRIEEEIRSHRFTRNNTAAPDQATAYITYIFK